MRSSEAEVGRGEQADVLRVLPVDLLDALRDDELDPARRAREYGAVSRDDPQPFEAPLTMTSKPPFLIASFCDDAAAQADQAVARERLVVVVANPAGRELVGRDVVDQRPSRDRTRGPRRRAAFWRSSPSEVR